MVQTAGHGRVLAELRHYRPTPSFDLGMILLAEDGDPVLAAACDAHFVKMIVFPVAVHFELAEHLPGVPDGGVGPTMDGLFGRFLALRQVIRRASVEAVAFALVPDPTPFVVVRVIRCAVPRDLHECRVHLKWRQLVLRAILVDGLDHPCFVS
jgi:hypothetical protein